MYLPKPGELEATLDEMRVLTNIYHGRILPRCYFDQDEIYSAALFAVARVLHIYHPRGATFKTVSCRYARGQIIDDYRAKWGRKGQRVHPRLDEAEVCSYLATRHVVEPPCAKAMEASDFARKAMRLLGKDEFQIIALHYWYDWEFREIAHVLGYTRFEVSRLHMLAMARMALWARATHLKKRNGNGKPMVSSPGIQTVN